MNFDDDASTIHRKVKQWLFEHPQSSADSCITSVATLMGSSPNESMRTAINEQSPSIDFSSCYLSKCDLIALTFSLPLRKAPIKSIRFGPQQIDSHYLRCLCLGFRELSELESLDLSHNPIGSIGGLQLLELSRLNPKLNSIELDGVEIVASLYKKLQRYLTRNLEQRKSI